MKDLRATTASPFLDSPERELCDALLRHCSLHGYESAEEAVFSWIERLIPEATKSFCERAHKLSGAITHSCANIDSMSESIAMQIEAGGYGIETH